MYGVVFGAKNLFMLVASERVYYKVAFATFEGIYCTYLEFKSVKQSPAKTSLRDLSDHGLSFFI